MQTILDFGIKLKEEWNDLDTVFRNMSINVRSVFLRNTDTGIIIKRFCGTDSYWSPVYLEKFKLKNK